MFGRIKLPDWVNAFPELAALDDSTWRQVMKQARVLSVPADTHLFRDGDVCSGYMLVLSGSVRVQKVAENGREITLYRIREGQSCALTTSCLLAGEHYPAEGITETDITAVMFPAAEFHQALERSPGFRRFVFSAYGQRISSLIVLVEALAFGRLDTRLADCLLRQADAAGRLETTHQNIAAELGTAREVISRQLKEFERKGWVELHRGSIVLTDKPSLQNLAHGTTM